MPPQLLRPAVNDYRLLLRISSYIKSAPALYVIRLLEDIGQALSPLTVAHFIPGLRRSHLLIRIRTRYFGLLIGALVAGTNIKDT
jgi:hypothetical protein